MYLRADFQWVMFSMETVEVRGKKFALFLSRETIQKRINELAEQMSRDLADKDPIFLCVLNGAFMFVSDLTKSLSIPCQVSFIKLASYQGMQRGTKIREVFGLTERIEGRTVVVVEDVVDSGHTMKQLLESLRSRSPQEIRIATLLFKPEAMVCGIQPDYVAFEIPNDFVIGFGMDYDGYGRTLDQVFAVTE